MNEKLKYAINQKLEHLSDESGRQLLDYLEFLESKFSRSRRDQSPFERIAENMEGTLRSSKLGDAAYKSTEGFIEAAGSLARSFAAAGQAMLDELQYSVDAETAQYGHPNRTDNEEDGVASGHQEQPSSESGQAKDDVAKTAERDKGGNENPA